MIMHEEGVIKFKCNWIQAAPPGVGLIKELNEWRNKLYDAKLIGKNKDGIGYGNISIRYQNNFIITGSSTGKLSKLAAEHYTVVTEYDLDKNTLTAVGPVIASSESLTHAVIYEHQKNVNAVMHIHHPALWKKLLETLPSTGKAVEYGTPAMAREILRLFEESDLIEEKIFAMGGHEEGVISFGKDLNEAGTKLFKML
jgi:ribulose-5-phosphate 4-epimerase/fuculose-1-phosphate aldolase